jgi:DNA-directed RNA polymerase III subunit RPC4
MHESAPTSLYRDRKLNDKGKAKVKVKDEKRKIKGKGKATTSTSEGPSVMEVDSQEQSINLGTAVKAEPISPTKPSIPLDPNEGVPPPGGWRDDDAMMSDDEEQDRDQSGRRVRSFAETGGNDSDDDDDDVNEAQKVDLSESEEEEEEDDLTADFTQVEGEVSPLPYTSTENKLTDVGRAREQAIHVPIPKPIPTIRRSKTSRCDRRNTSNQRRSTERKRKRCQTRCQARYQTHSAKKHGVKPPEGRIGSLVVMKSGRVKMVLGDGIVMNVCLSFFKK